MCKGFVSGISCDKLLTVFGSRNPNHQQKEKKKEKILE